MSTEVYFIPPDELRRRLTQRDWINLQAYYAMKDDKSELYKKVLDDEAREIARNLRAELGL